MNQQKLIFEEPNLTEHQLPHEQQMALVDLMAQIIIAAFQKQRGESHEHCVELENYD